MSVPAPQPQRDADCPACGYNLRGLLDAERVTCPECGAAHDVHEVLNPTPADRIGLWYAGLWLPGVAIGLLAGAASRFRPQLPNKEILGPLLLVATIGWLTYLLWYPFVEWTRPARLLLIVFGVASFTVLNAILAVLVGWVVNTLLWAMT